MFLVLGAANEDGSDEPDEHRREHGPLTGTGPYAPLPWPWRPRRSWGPNASWPAGFSPKHASSADAQQHGASHGPRRHAASFHAPWTDGATLWTPASPGAPSGHDGATRHARTPRYAETPRPSQKHGSPRASWYGTQRDAGAPWWDDGPPSSWNRSKGSSGSSTPGGHDATSREHDGSSGSYAGWDDGAPTQDTRQHAKQLWDGQHAGATGRNARASRKHAGAPR